MSQTLKTYSKNPEYTYRIKYALSTICVIKSFHQLHYKSMARLKEAAGEMSQIDNFSDWIIKYNWKRPHGGIKIQTPILKL
ncbi:MAG: hypothetical protein SWO11_17870 [Thermodesulfobacteriota bacterium]|nr:hypothetical protein [Thermodesulfobacteriota bacterium]